MLVVLVFAVMIFVIAYSVIGISRCQREQFVSQTVRLSFEHAGAQTDEGLETSRWRLEKISESKLKEEEARNYDLPSIGQPCEEHAEAINDELEKVLEAESETRRRLDEIYASVGDVESLRDEMREIIAGLSESVDDMSREYEEEIAKLDKSILEDMAEFEAVHGLEGQEGLAAAAERIVAAAEARMTRAEERGDRAARCRDHTRVLQEADRKILEARTRQATCEAAKSECETARPLRENVLLDRAEARLGSTGSSVKRSGRDLEICRGTMCRPFARVPPPTADRTAERSYGASLSLDPDDPTTSILVHDIHLLSLHRIENAEIRVGTTPALDEARDVFRAPGNTAVVPGLMPDTRYYVWVSGRDDTGNAVGPFATSPPSVTTVGKPAATAVQGGSDDLPATDKVSVRAFADVEPSDTGTIVESGIRIFVEDGEIVMTVPGIVGRLVYAIRGPMVDVEILGTASVLGGAYLYVDGFLADSTAARSGRNEVAGGAFTVGTNYSNRINGLASAWTSDNLPPAASRGLNS